MRYIIILLFASSIAFGQNADSLQFEITKEDFLAEYTELPPVEVTPEYMETVPQVESVKILKKQFDFAKKFQREIKEIKRYNLNEGQKLDYDLISLILDRISTYADLRASMFDVNIVTIDRPKKSNSSQMQFPEETDNEEEEEDEGEWTEEDEREQERKWKEKYGEKKVVNDNPEIVDDSFDIAVDLKPTGLWSTGNGEAWYQFYLDYYYGGSSPSPDKIRVFAISQIRMADRDLKNLQLEMGFSDDSLSFYQHITSQQNYYNNATTLANEGQGRAELVAAGAYDLFGISIPTPKVKITDGLTEMKASENTLYLAMSEKGYPKYALDRTILEMVSGHYLLTQLPPVKSPFIEMVSTKAMEDGWAIYNSRIGDKLGLYNENVDKLGKVMAQKERAVAARIDYGIHIEAWSKEKALKFWNEQLPWNVNGQFMVSEIMAKPAYFSIGPWVAFEIGNKLMSSKIIWDVVLKPREYYNMVLGFGKLPVGLLFDRVEREAKKKQGK